MASKQEVLSQITRLRAQLDALTAQIADAPALVNAIPDGIRPWRPGVFAVGDLRMYDGIPRRCVQTHDSTSNPIWTPDVASLWMQYHGTSADTARAYIAPTGAHDAYKSGEYAIWQGAVYRVADGQDNIAYSPTDYPAGWTAAQ